MRHFLSTEVLDVKLTNTRFHKDGREMVTNMVLAAESKFQQVFQWHGKFDEKYFTIYGLKLREGNQISRTSKTQKHVFFFHK